MRYKQYISTPEAVWFDSVPASWRATKMREVFSERNEKVSDKEYAPLSVGKMGVVPQLETAVKTDNGDNRKLICRGDFAINSRSDRKGAGGISKYDGSASLIITVLKPHNDINGRFYHYLLRSYCFSEEFYRNGHGLVSDLWTTKWDEMRNIYVPVPPRGEQDQIVRYLDWKISRIDKLIYGYQREIELLEEQKQTLLDLVVHGGLNDSVKKKDSGIEYLGEIPENWAVLQNHRLYQSMNRRFSGNEIVLSLSQKDGLIPYESMSERSLHTASYENWQLVLPNDLVLNRFKAHLGVFFASNYRGIATFHYGVYEAKRPLISKYYETLYHTPVYCRVYAGQSNGMTVGLQNLSDINFYTVYTVYPPIEEQKVIVSVIEKKEKEFLKLRAKIEREVELLKEYRTSLISDVVTGQLDVRGIEIPDYKTEEDAKEADDKNNEEDAAENE